MNPFPCLDYGRRASDWETVFKNRITRGDARESDLVSCGDGGCRFASVIEIESVARFEGIDGYCNIVGRVHVNDAMLFCRDGGDSPFDSDRHRSPPSL
jgi:hypothetical protein